MTVAAIVIALTFHPGALLAILVYGVLLGWFVWRWSRKSEDPPGVLVLKLVATLGLGALAILVGVSLHPLIGIPLAAAIAIIIGILWGKNVGAAIAKPLSSLYDGGDEEVEPRPFYAIAEAHRKQARYEDAVREIEKQLDRFPGDVEGLLKLAEIRARHLGDWTGAGVAIDQIAENTALPVSTRSKALLALADWNLDWRNDGGAASECLRRIQELFPETPEAHEAAQRLAHVGDGEWRRARQAPQRLRVTAGDPHLGLRVPGDPDAVVQAPSPASTPDPDPEEQVRQLLAHLAVHPVDTEARERLALVYADRLGRLDWAMAEIDKLVALPGQSARQVARWWHLLADLQIRNAGDEGAARAALGRIIEAYPNSAVAANAQSRLDYLKLELRRQAKTDYVGAGRPPEAQGPDAPPAGPR